MAKPIIAIVGRPNVGKSTLFNYLGRKRMSIVEDVPGVTRDRLYMDAEWCGVEFTLVDTGGIEIYSKDDDMMTEIRYQAMLAVEEADAVIFMTDVKTGITTVDEDIAAVLRGKSKAVTLAVNKVDSLKDEQDIYEFYNLGLGEPYAISAVNALNLGDMLDSVVLPLKEQIKEENMEEDIIRIAFIGRPNVGKSSLVNALLGTKRVIVSKIAGTTRDSIDTPFTLDDRQFILIDTAGMRRKAKVDLPVERYSVMRTLKAVDRSDIAVIMIDAVDGITEQDKKIAGYAHEAGKGCVIVVNKWDLIEKDDKTTLKYTENIRNELGFMQYAPIAFISAFTKQRIFRVIEIVKHVAEQQTMRIATGMLNQVINDAVAVNPPANVKGKRVKFLYTVQVSVKPPCFIFFVNEPEIVHFSYLRYLENKLRQMFGFEGTPLKIIIRGKKEKND